MKYAAFFRGINVGGKNMVKMAELRKLFSDLGFQKVQTYIQSGNAVFEAGENASQATKKIQDGFSAAFGFECAVMLRTAEEMTGIVEGLPFSEQELSEAAAACPEAEHLYVYLLDELDTGRRRQFDEMIGAYSGRDRMKLGEGVIYLMCRESIRNSEPAARLSKLRVSMTARNWKTISKIHEMMSEEPPAWPSSQTI